MIAGLLLAVSLLEPAAQAAPADPPPALTPRVTVSQAPAAIPPGQTEPDQKVPCPMQLDIPLGKPTPKGLSLAEVQLKHAWTSSSMRPYVCHEERIAHVTILKRDEKHGRSYFTVSTTVQSEEWRQDVDLTVAILAPNGKQICGEKWTDLTVGKDRSVSNYTWVTMASHTKSPEFDCSIRTDDLATMFTDGKTPTLRLILRPKLDEDDEKKNDELESKPQ
jgi:hypothetical protein